MTNRNKKRKSKLLESLKFKKFGGEICRRLIVDNLLDELREDDYIVYWEEGWSVGKIKKNHKGYKHRWIQIYARKWGEHVLCRSKKIKPEKIREGWRKLEDE